MFSSKNSSWAPKDVTLRAEFGPRAASLTRLPQHDPHTTTHLTPKSDCYFWFSGEPRKLPQGPRPPPPQALRHFFSCTCSSLFRQLALRCHRLPTKPLTAPSAARSSAKRARGTGVAKHNPNDLHWFHSPFKCCKKDSTHLTVPN